jgi:hypothetical protein
MGQLHLKPSTYVGKHSLANFVVLVLDLPVMDRLALKVGNDIQTFLVAVLVNQETGRLGTDKASETKDETSNDLDRQREAP